MAGQNVIWLDGIANVNGIVEKICPGRHVRQNEWQPQWNNMYLAPNDHHRYDYISDYECIFNHPMDHMGNQHLQENQELWQNLQDAKNQGCPLQITDLAHFTNGGAAQQIVNDYGFRGGLKKINEGENHDDVWANLSWWSPVFTDAERNSFRVHLGEVIQPFTDPEEGDDLDALKNQFATSDAFQPSAWRYGRHLFRYEKNLLCKTYSQLVYDELCYKILGTFGYKQVMHAVLVCSEVDGAGQFAGYPDVLTPEEDINNEAVITRDDIGNWYWRPQATGGGEILRLQAHWQNYPRYRRWEHVAFAFHIPDDEIMVCDSPADHHCTLAENGDDSEDED